MDTTLMDQLKQLVSEQLGIDEEEVTRDAHFADDLGADSLDRIEIVMVAEEEFGIEIPDDAGEHLVTFGVFVDYVTAKVEQKRRGAA